MHSGQRLQADELNAAIDGMGFAIALLMNSRDEQDPMNIIQTSSEPDATGKDVGEH